MKTTWLILVLTITFCIIGHASAKASIPVEVEKEYTTEEPKEGAKEKEGDDKSAKPDKKEGDKHAKHDKKEEEFEADNMWDKVHNVINAEAEEMTEADLKILGHRVIWFLKDVQKELPGIEAVKELNKEAYNLDPEKIFTHEKKKLDSLRRSRFKRRMMKRKMRRMRKMR